MAAATETFDSAGIRLKRARGGVETMDGKAAGLWTQRIETGWRGLAGATNDGGSSSCPAQRQLEEGIGMDWTEASRPAQGEERRRGAIADAWRRSPAATAAVWRRTSTVDGQEKHSDAQRFISNDFDQFLTGQSSKFDMGTRNLAKIKVVEENKSYNFHFGRTLI